MGRRELTKGVLEILGMKMPKPSTNAYTDLLSGAKMIGMSRVVLAAFLIVLSAPVVAQRGMRGYASGRVAMGGPAPARMGFARGPQMRPSFAVPRTSIVVRPRTTFVPQRRGTITFGHINGGPSFTSPRFGNRFDHRFHHHHAFFFGVPYYSAYWPAYYGDYVSPYSFGSYAYDSSANTNYYTDLSGRVGELDAEVGELRDENDSLRSALDEQHRPAALVAPPSASAPSEPATVLVFRDGHRTEVQNYAIVGSTVWLLSSTRADKVPLSALDVDQTVKANEERGLTFGVPESRRGK
jgi:hypothetical protein